MGIKYSKIEKLSFDKQVAQGKTEQIRIRSRTHANIMRRLKNRGLIPKRGFPPLKKAQRKKLRQLISDNCSPEQIAEFEMLGKEAKPRTVHNIRKWMGRLRLVNKNRSRSARRRKILNKREKKSFDNFLRKHSTELSAQQIARKFGVKPGTVQARQRQLGVKPPFSVVMRIPSVRRKYLAGMRKRSAKMFTEFDLNIAKREEELIRLQQAMMATNGKQSVAHEERTCKVCKRTWFKHNKFFYHNEVRHKGYTTWHFSNICVICEAKRRHNKRLEEK
jgi:hypothetical protein